MTQTPGEFSERKLIQNAKSGDLEALGMLIQLHHQACLGRATAILGNSDDAKEVVQDAYVRALQRLEQFRGEGTFAAWMDRIVENRCRMRIRASLDARLITPGESHVRVASKSRLVRARQELRSLLAQAVAAGPRTGIRPFRSVRLINWRTLLRLVMTPGDYEALIGDLQEKYASIFSRRGKKSADDWFRSQVLSSFWPMLYDRVRRGLRSALRQARRLGG